MIKTILNTIFRQGIGTVHEHMCRCRATEPLTLDDLDKERIKKTVRIKKRKYYKMSTIKNRIMLTSITYNQSNVASNNTNDLLLLFKYKGVKIYIENPEVFNRKYLK